MVTRKRGVTASLLVLALLAVPPVTAQSGADACVGGKDAGESYTDPTPIEVFMGCEGVLYKAEEGSNNEDDLYDAYSTRSDKMKPLKARTEFQVCNLSPVPMIYQVIWKTDGLTYERHRIDGLGEGECSSPDPEIVEGGTNPGTWIFTVDSREDLFPQEGKAKYSLYVGQI